MEEVNSKIYSDLVYFLKFQILQRSSMNLDISNLNVISIEAIICNSRLKQIIVAVTMHNKKFFVKINLKMHVEDFYSITVLFQLNLIVLTNKVVNNALTIITYYLVIVDIFYL